MYGKIIIYVLCINLTSLFKHGFYKEHLNNKKEKRKKKKEKERTVVPPSSSPLTSNATKALTSHISQKLVWREKAGDVTGWKYPLPLSILYYLG